MNQIFKFARQYLAVKYRPKNAVGWSSTTVGTVGTK